VPRAGLELAPPYVCAVTAAGVFDVPFRIVKEETRMAAGHGLRLVSLEKYPASGIASGKHLRSVDAMTSF
jgi:hypothetical protein